MSVKIYSYNDRTQLSAHFNVKEFKCKCGKSHEIKIDSELIVKLEKLYSVLDCSKIIINSGYRCSAHDKSVGGNGSGQHTKGTAVDIVCYNKDGKIISAKIVTCVAQDIGFNGVGNISAKYQAVHVDVRSGKWYGDEIKGTGTVTSDFYKYWGLTKADVYGVEAPKTKKVTLIIDGVTYEGELTAK